jgi:hypothetical protein
MTTAQSHTAKNSQGNLLTIFWVSVNGGDMNRNTASSIPAVCDLKLWDSNGNYCKCELYHIGQNVFELYLHDFNDAIPRRFIGGLGALNSRVELWVSEKKSQGFEQQLPSYNPHGTRES